MRQEDEERNGGNDRQRKRLEAKDGKESKRQEEREGVS